MTTSTTGTAGTSGFKPVLWTPGDWNAFFGFGTNILVNMLVLTGLLRFVLKMPDTLVFGRILPALGLMMCLSTFYYAWLAYRLAQKTGRSDVCALPSGVSVPHMFIVTFVIMLPIAIKTGDPMKAWSAGLVWVFFQSFILMIGGFIAPVIRRITPRAALLGTLAGVSEFLKSRRASVHTVLADPPGSGLYEYIRHGQIKITGSGSITEGIGIGRVTANMQGAPIDAAEHVEDAETVGYVYRLLREEGLFVSSTSGINVAGSVRIARQLGPGHTIVTVLCDTGAKYLSRLFNRDWLKQKGLLQSAWPDQPD